MHILDIVATVCVSFAALGLVKSCPTQMLTASSGEFTSEGYPNSLYPNGRRCRFVIKAEPGNIVKITFTKFELESPHKGRRTNFVKVIDGFAKHPAQVVYYEGIRKTPFNFVSRTRIVTIVLKTNGQNRGKGFHATYRQIMPVLRDLMYCGYPEVDNWWGNCKDEEDQEDEQLYDYCDITCDSEFQLVGDKTARCNTDIGEWTDLPQCAMRPDILEICLKDITNEDCPYPAEMLADHYMKETPDEDGKKQMVALTEELGDRMRDFDVKGVALVARQVICDRRLCDYNWTSRSFVNSCRTHSLTIHEAQRRDWLVICLKCQDTGCGTIQIYL